MQSQIKEWIESIKNKQIPDDIKEMVDSYYECMEEDVVQILSDMTNIHNNDINLSDQQTDDELHDNVELFPQETDVNILDEIERLMSANQQIVSQNYMFSMFNPSEPSIT